MKQQKNGSGQEQRAEYIITQIGMNLAIAVLKENKFYDEAESVLSEIRKYDEAAIKTAAYAEGFNDGQQTGCGARDAAIRRQAQEEERERILKLLITAMNHGYVIGWHDTKVGRILDYTIGAQPATDFESEITKVIEKLRDKEKKEGPA